MFGGRKSGILLYIIIQSINYEELRKVHIFIWGINIIYSPEGLQRNTTAKHTQVKWTVQH